MLHCKVLLVIGELYSDAQKDALGKDVLKGLLNFPFNEDVDLNDELSKFVAASPSVNKDETGVDFLHYNSPNMETRVLFQPTLSALEVVLDNWLQDGQPSSVQHRFLVYAGSVTAQRGHWLLADSLLTSDHLLNLMKHTSTIVKKTQTPAMNSGDQPNGAGHQRLHISIGSAVARSSPDWKNWTSDALPGFDVSVNNANDLPNDAPGLVQFGSYIIERVRLDSLESRVPLSEVVGTIQFSRPTLYLFPEGQGDSCLIGVDGFNLLINSGYSKSPNCWSFARHLSRIDGFLQTHWSSNNLEGIRSILDRKLLQQQTDSEDKQGPPIGVFLSPPGPQRAHTANKTIDSAAQPEPDSLVVVASLQANAVHKSAASLKIHQVELSLQKPAMHPKAITLFSKVGLGSLELYPLNPSEDDPELKRFLDEWHFHHEHHQQQQNDSKSGRKTPQHHTAALTLAQQLSLCCLIVWRPHKNTEPITRLLLTGACHQSYVIQATDLLFHQNNMDYLKHFEAIPAKMHSRSETSLQSAKSTMSSAATKSSRPASTKTNNSSAPSAAAKSSAGSFKKPAVPPSTAAGAAVSQQNGGVAKKPNSATSNSSTAQSKTGKPPATTSTTPRSSKPKPTTNNSQTSAKRPTSSSGGGGDAKKKSPTVATAPSDIVKPQITPNSEETKELGEIKSNDLNEKSDDHQLLETVNHDDGAVKAEIENEHSQSLSSQPTEEHSQMNDDETFSLETPAVVSASNQELVEQLPEGLPDPRPNVLTELPLNSHDNNFKEDDFSSELVTPASPSSGGGLSLHLDPNRPTSATVECAIPEGGEADFHDESPQHFTADQLKEMGVYNDDDDEDSDPNNVSHGSDSKPTVFNPISEWGPPQSLPQPGDVENPPPPPPAESEPTAADAPPPAVVPPSAAGDSADTTDKPEESKTKKGGSQPSDSNQKKGAPPPPSNQKRTGATPSSSSNKTAADSTKKPTSATARPSASTGTPRPTSSSTKPSTGSATARDSNRASAAKKKPEVSQPPTTGDRKPAVPSSKRVDSAKVSPAPGQSIASLNLIGNKNPYGRVHACHFDLATIPANGDNRMVDVEFFKRVRARYYVLSCLKPDVNILDALLIGKESWGTDGISQPVTLIPTYDSVEMLQWMTDNKDKLSRLHLEIAPAAARCPIQLQDHETVCAAYRVEF